MGAAPSRPERRVRAKPFSLVPRAARSLGEERGGRGGKASASAHARAPLPPVLSSALARVGAGRDDDDSVESLRQAWEADQEVLLAAVRALTAVVTGVGAADGGGLAGQVEPPPTTADDDHLPPDAATWLATHDPDALAVKAALTGGRTLAAAAAQRRLCERERVSVGALGARRDQLGWDAALLDRRAATLGVLLDAVDSAAAGTGGFTRLVEAKDGLTIDYRTLRPPAGEAGPTLHALVMNDDFPADCAALLALTRESDLVKAWNPFCTVASVLEIGGDRPGWTRVAYAAMRMMPGFPTFDILARGVGHDCGEERRALAVTLAQPTPDEAEAPPTQPAVRHPAEPPSAAGCHRVSLHPGSGLLFTPLAPDPATGRHRSLGTLAVAMHLRLPFVPPILVRWAVQFLLPLLARSLKRHLVGPWFTRSAPAVDDGEGAAMAAAAPAAPAAWASGVGLLRRTSTASPREAVGLFADRIAASFTYGRLGERVAEVGAGLDEGWPADRKEWEAWWRAAVFEKGAA